MSRRLAEGTSVDDLYDLAEALLWQKAQRAEEHATADAAPSLPGYAAFALASGFPPAPLPARGSAGAAAPLREAGIEAAASVLVLHPQA